MSTDLSPRDEALRRHLVATVDAGPAPAPPRWRVAVAAVGAFAIAGALTGGTLATVNAAPAPPAVVDLAGPPIFEDDVRILSTPLILTGSEPADVDLGAAPAGANGLALAIYCLDLGSYQVSLDGRFEMGTECTPGTGPDLGGGGGVILFDGPAPRSLSVDLDGGEYAVWAAWVNQPADAEPSATQQEALADGVVAREEYVAGFERYVACMADLGFEVHAGDTTSETIGYSIEGDAGLSGAAGHCYEAEFAQLDVEWQLAHPARSAAQQAALADGVITREEYVAGFERAVSCVEEMGYTVDPGDPQAETLSYTVQQKPGSDGISEYCDAFEFDQVQAAWQVAHED
jgi:hypothetical protein